MWIGRISRDRSAAVCAGYVSLACVVSVGASRYKEGLKQRDTSPGSWEVMTSKLVDGLPDKPVGFVLDLGPRSYLPDDDEGDEVVCAQIQMREDGVLMLRRARAGSVRTGTQ